MPLLRLHTPALVAAVLAACALGAFWRLAPAVGFPLDDAWIHMVYGRNLAESGLLAYNAGVPGTGSTAPLWSAVVGLVHLLAQTTAARVEGVLLVGAAAHVLLSAMSAVLARPAGPAAALLAGLLVATCPPLLAAALSGMEVSLCAALLVVGLAAASGQRWRLAGTALALACACRPESAVVGLVLVWPALEARRLPALALPAVVIGGAWIGWDLWASGRPLPATFYAKQQFEPTDLLRRIEVAFRAMLSQVSPFTSPAPWLAVLGLVHKVPGRRTLACGLLFLLANLVLVRPRDPAAFFHLRYLLPAVPLLLVGLSQGVVALGGWFSGPLAVAPPALMALAGTISVAATFGSVAEHHRSDVRSILQVQVTLGEMVASRVPENAWIAASDAGAVRYFSNRSTIDVMGLNTPEFQDPDWRAAHPVGAAVLMLPGWFTPDDPGHLAVYGVAKADDYRVTSDLQMAQQVMVGCTEARRIGFSGVRTFWLDCLPIAESGDGRL